MIPVPCGSNATQCYQSLLDAYDKAGAGDVLELESGTYAGGGSIISGVIPGNDVINASAIMQAALGHDQHIQSIDRESTGVGRNSGIGSCSRRLRSGAP